MIACTAPLLADLAQPPDITIKPFRTEMSLVTNDPARPLLKVPLEIQVRHQRLPPTTSPEVEPEPEPDEPRVDSSPPPPNAPEPQPQLEPQLEPAQLGALVESESSHTESETD